MKLSFLKNNELSRPDCPKKSCDYSEGCCKAYYAAFSNLSKPFQGICKCFKCLHMMCKLDIIWNLLLTEIKQNFTQLIHQQRIIVD